MDVVSLGLSPHGDVEEGWRQPLHHCCVSAACFFFLSKRSPLTRVLMLTATFCREEHYTRVQTIRFVIRPTKLSPTTNSEKHMSLCLHSHQFYSFFTLAVLKQITVLHNKSTHEHAHTSVSHVYTWTPDVLETLSFPENNLLFPLKELIQHVNCPPLHTCIKVY